jgi:hypothetical protein
MVASDAGVSFRIESHCGGRRAAENQLTMRAERDDVDIGRARAS